MTVHIVKALNAIEQSRGFIQACRQLVPEATQGFQYEQLLNDDRSIADMISQMDIENEKHLLDYRKAFCFLTNHFLPHAITEETICEMHTRLFEGSITNPETLGKFRKIQNYLYKIEEKKVVFTPPPPEKVRSHLNELLNWIRKERALPPILIAGIAHLGFLEIHPFLDGNGRTGQLLTSVLLHQEGYDFKDLFCLGEFYMTDRDNYNGVLQSSRTKERDLTGWLEYFTHAFAKQMSEAQSLVSLSCIAHKQKIQVTQSKPLAGRFVFACPKSD